MLESNQTQRPTVIGTALCAGFAALAGFGAFILPQFLIRGGIMRAAEKHPLIPWFAKGMENLHLRPTLACLVLVGVILGVAQPKYWPISCFLTVSPVALLHTANVIHDWTRDATSHNLWPFEFLGLAVDSFPAIAGVERAVSPGS